MGKKSRKNRRNRSKSSKSVRRDNSLWKKTLAGCILGATALGISGVYYPFARSHPDTPPPASELPRPTLNPQRYLNNLSPGLKERVAQENYVLISLAEEETVSSSVVEELVQGIKKTYTDRLRKILGNDISINIRLVANSRFVSPAKNLEEKVIRTYLKRSIQDFNEYIADLHVQRSQLKVRFPKTKSELKAMKYPTIYYVGASMDVRTVWVDLTSNDNNRTEQRRLDRVRQITSGGGDINGTINLLSLGDPEAIQLKSGPILIYTNDSRFDYNVFDPSPVFEYFHSLAYSITAKHFSQEISQLARGGAVSADQIQQTAQRWDTREEIFVHAVVSVWLESYFARNNNLGLPKDKIEACFISLDKPPYIGARNLMPEIRASGPNKVYESYRDTPDEIFAAIDK